MQKTQNSQSWTVVIRSKRGWFNFNARELFHYRDLVWLFVKRLITTRYKQTVLGPLWLFITPLITTLVSTFVFGTIAGIESGTVPYFLFYFCGFTAWSYFAACITQTANTFTANAAIFGKVYFPRLVIPLATVISSLLNLFVQFIMLIGFMVYFRAGGADVSPVWSYAWLLPLLVIQMSLLGFGCGIIISSFTTKYRDLIALIPIGVDLWKYITPVIYAVSSLSGKIRAFSLINPMSSIVEAFRYICLGEGAGELLPIQLLISAASTMVVLLLGVILFSRVEKTFMDTV